MRKVLKWTGMIVGSLIVIVIVAVGVLYWMGNNKFTQVRTVQSETLAIPTDAASIAYGQHFVEAISGCIGCHGENLAGKYFINEPGFAVIAAPNLTAGRGGIGATYTDDDWVRAIRHGVGGDGRAFVGMPSNWYYYLSDPDLAAIIAYVKSVPPVDNELPARQAAFFTKILLALGAFPIIPDHIDHTTRPTVPELGVTQAYGEYLSYVAACRECHGDNLAGNSNPNGPPMGPNLTPSGSLQSWTEADFITALRTGQVPGGYQLSEEMPWLEYRNMTDDELKTIWLYLQSLPALPTNRS